MDYLTQAKTFLHRAQVANDIDEKMAHLNMAAEMLAKGVEELGQSRPMIGVSGLSRQERTCWPSFKIVALDPASLSRFSPFCWRGALVLKLNSLPLRRVLELKGVLTTDVAQTGYELTHAGYLRP